MTNQKFVNLLFQSWHSESPVSEIVEYRTKVLTIPVYQHKAWVKMKITKNWVVKQ